MRSLVPLLLVGLLCCSFLGVTYAGDIAVVVNLQNKMEGLSFVDLIRIFRQERQYWENGQKIYLILQEAGSPEKELVLRRIYRMKNEELKKFWLAKMFRGEISSFPKTLGSNEAVKRFVSQVPQAIGFIDVSFVDERVKVLRINGKLPGQPGYVLGE